MLKIIIDQVIKILRSKEKVDFTHVNSNKEEVVVPVMPPRRVILEGEDIELGGGPKHYLVSTKVNVTPTLHTLYTTVSSKFKRRWKRRRSKQRGPE